ncbi:hypothetical protein [Lysobacter gummosus]|uniref:hypothetical protein n=1 Tax=Lysobacter gummosus TaxID=262324 RepID=UPI0036258147
MHRVVTAQGSIELRGPNEPDSRDAGPAFLCLRHSKPSFPRTRESSVFVVAARKSLDSRVRGNDGR